MIKRKSCERILLLALVSLVILCCVGCAILPGVGKPLGDGADLPKELDPFRLRLGVEQVIDKSISAIVANAGDIAVKSEDRLVRENSVRWKIRANDAYQAVLLEPDARVAFIHGWTVTVQLRKSLVEGVSKEDFGEFQASAIRTIKDVEADFVELGRQNFSVHAIEAAADDIEDLGTGGLSVAALTGQLRSSRKGGGDVLNMIKIPLIPVTALGAVGDTPMAINRFTEATRGIGAVMQQLPEKTRWQLELLLLETGSSGALARILSTADDMQETVNQAVAKVQSLPAEIRAEFEQSLAAVRETQPEMVAMLTQARDTIDELKSTIQQANGTVDQTRQLLGSLEEPTGQIVQVAQEFQQTAKEVRGLIGDWDAYSSKGEPKENKEDAITIRDYAQMAVEMREAAEQFRGLLADLDKPLAEKKSINETAGAVQELIDKAFGRAVLLVLIVLLAAVVYRLVARALTRKVPAGQR